MMEVEYMKWICVDFLDSCKSLVELDVEMRIPLFIAPIEEDLESASVTVDGAYGQPFLTHLQYYVLQVLRGQTVHRNGCIHPLGDGSEVVLVGF